MTQAVHTEGKKGENWQTNYSQKLEDLNLRVSVGANYCSFFDLA